MLTQQAMGWNQRKTTTLHKALSQRYIKVGAFCLTTYSYVKLFQQGFLACICSCTGLSYLFLLKMCVMVYHI